ncbi:MAG: cache domain-containing protein [bacterium]|nr:cache domain-containing protein [bacterium]
MKIPCVNRRALKAAALPLTLLVAGCGRGPSADPGVADPATVQGFPAYANSVLSSTIAIVEEAVLEEERILRALSVIPQVKSAEWEEMRGLLAPFQQAWKDSGVYWFAKSDGNYYTVGQGLVGRTLSDRPYFPAVMAGRPVVGDLVISRSTGRKSAVIVLPMPDRRGRIVGALGASLFLDRLSERMAASLSLPEGTFFYALAPDGTTALHMKLDLVFDNPMTRDSPTLRVAAERMLSTDSGEVEYEFNGFRKRVRYMTWGRTGWRFAFGMNTAVTDSGRKKGR